ncbi:MAG: TlpA disulfide reductase family protein [Methylovulum sp.]|nr:TlpA disulfide reductase family protein [Methylovulum sp.]
MNQRIAAFFSVLLAAMPLQPLFALDKGDNMPDCALTPVGDTQRYNLQQFKGKVLYVDFWASWCGPCAKSFPFLNDTEQKYQGQALKIIGINLDENPNDAQDFLAKYPANFTVVADVGEQCAQTFAVKAMPSSYIIDKKGVIRHIQLGFRTGEAKELDVLLGQLLAE